jgi:uncharacterized repeat protein (TIGR03803 family)
LVRSVFAGLLAAFPLACAGAVSPGFEIVHTFPQPWNLGLGTIKSRLVAGPDGNFYGVAATGGTLGGGGIFRVTPAGKLTTLHEFSYSGFDGPGGLTAGRDGNFYGVLGSSESTPPACVYRITPAGEYTKLLAFDGTTTGSQPRLPLALGADGSLYGTTFDGGDHGAGTAFKVSTAGVYTRLASFGPDTGGKPLSGLSLAGDDGYYAVVGDGGVYHMVRMTPSGQLTLKATLTQPDLPLGPMTTAADGKLYGMTLAGGAFHAGSVFRMESDGSLTTLYSFRSNEMESFYNSSGELMSASGELTRGLDDALYGTTPNGGDFGGGTLFRVTRDGQFSIAAKFSLGRTVAGPAQGPGGTFYAATIDDGSLRKGTLVKVSPDGTPSVLVDPGQKAAAYYPGGLIQMADGTLYGTSSGGVDNAGTVFRITPGDHYTQLVDCPPDSANPNSLLAGTDGNFYFAAQSGGFNQLGAVVRMTPDGTLSTVAQMTAATGINPHLLVQTQDGNFYGTTSKGPFDASTNIFRVDPAGAVTDLYNVVPSFSGSTGIRLVHTKDDNLFGIDLPYSAQTPHGTFIQRIAAGQFAQVAGPFDNTGAAGAPDVLVEAKDGSLYGSVTGADSDSLIFKMTRKGVYTQVARFDDATSSHPNSLAQGPDGNFYGTAAGVAIYNPGPSPTNTPGTLFKMTPAGVVTTLLTFDPAHGTFPTSLISGTDGNFYGATGMGGVPADGTPGGGGVVFRLRFGPAPVTEPATALTTTTVTVGGTVDPRGKATSVTLQYGTDPDLSPSTSVTLGTAGAAASMPVRLQKALKGLKALTRYYYRVNGKNADNPNIQHGEILSFVTQGPFDTWLAARGLAGAAADEDGDGITDLLEYAMDTDPHVANTAPAVAQGNTLVSHGGPFLQASGDGGSLVAYTRRKDRAAAGLTYTVQFSSDLANWTDSTAVPVVAAADATLEMVTVPMAASGTGQPQFFRLLVEAP